MLTQVMSFTGPDKPLIRVNNLSNSVTRTMPFLWQEIAHSVSAKPINCLRRKHHDVIITLRSLYKA